MVIGCMLMMGGAALMEPVILASTFTKTFLFSELATDPYIYNMGSAL
jgi:hypothetical protein